MSTARHAVLHALIDRYYAIACALALSLLNWALVGLFADQLDLFYLESWQVFLTCIVIFSGLSNISSAIFMYRLNADSLGNALINNFKVSCSGFHVLQTVADVQWVIFFFFFFCGLSWHLSTAL